MQVDLHFTILLHVAGGQRQSVAWDVMHQNDISEARMRDEEPEGAASVRERVEIPPGDVLQNTTQNPRVLKEVAEGYARLEGRGARDERGPRFGSFETVHGNPPMSFQFGLYFGEEVGGGGDDVRGDEPFLALERRPNEVGMGRARGQ